MNKLNYLVTPYDHKQVINEPAAYFPEKSCIDLYLPC